MILAYSLDPNNKKASSAMSQTISHQNRSQARTCALQHINSGCEETRHTTADLILCVVLAAVSGAIRHVSGIEHVRFMSHKRRRDSDHRRHSLDFLKTVRFEVS